MKIVLASSAGVGIPVAEHIFARGDLAAVITAPDKTSGRGQKTSANEFAQYCEKFPVNQYKPSTHSELNEILRDLLPDLVVTVAYGKLIRRTELSIPKHGFLNIHFSLLPRWRGASPVQHAILHGDMKSGVTVFKLDEGMDTGPIYSQIEIDLNGKETTGKLLEVMSEQSLSALDDALDQIRRGVEPHVQSDDGVSLAPKISKADGFIDWTRDAQYIDRQIRALDPWPHGWTTLRGSRVIVNSAEIAHSYHFPSTARAGEINLHQDVYVRCGQGQLRIIEVTPEGRRRMSSIEWLRGLQNHQGLRFE